MAIYRVTSAVIVVLLLQACGRDPHHIQITSKNKDTFMDEIKDMKGLTVDEVRLLIAYQVRGGIAKHLAARSEIRLERR